jgi:hypothetical protein
MSSVERKAAVPLRSPKAIAHIALTKGRRTPRQLLHAHQHLAARLQQLQRRDAADVTAPPVDSMRIGPMSLLPLLLTDLLVINKKFWLLSTILAVGVRWSTAAAACAPVNLMRIPPLLMTTLSRVCCSWPSVQRAPQPFVPVPPPPISGNTAMKQASGVIGAYFVSSGASSHRGQRGGADFEGN